MSSSFMLRTILCQWATPSFVLCCKCNAVSEHRAYTRVKTFACMQTPYCLWRGAQHMQIL
jgi:hypothetical protein